METHGYRAVKKVLSGSMVTTFNHCAKPSYIPHTNPAVEHQVVVINNVRSELQPHELKCPKICVLDIRTPSLILLLGGVEG